MLQDNNVRVLTPAFMFLHFDFKVTIDSGKPPHSAVSAQGDATAESVSGILHVPANPIEVLSDQLNSKALGFCGGGQLAKNELLYHAAEHALRGSDRKVAEY
jgi:hypothetical protein